MARERSGRRGAFAWECVSRRAPGGEIAPRCSAISAPWSMHHIFGEPALPFRQVLGAHLVVDDDGLGLPLLRRGEDSRQLRQVGAELGMHVHGRALVELAEVLL